MPLRREHAIGRVLIACEFSGIVRDAFAEAGFDAWSCDLETTERIGQHIQGDVRDVLDEGWDLMVAFPPCTYLAYSGARWWKVRQPEQAQALDFVRVLMAAPIGKIAIENPDGILNKAIRRHDQIIEPYHFGHHERKATCLWLTNLPRLRHTDVVTPHSASRILAVKRGPHRARDRSRTYPGIAAAMADQWGAACLNPTSPRR